MKWLDGESFRVNDATFRCSESFAHMHGEAPEGHFVVAKTREMIEKLCERLSPYEGGNIMELGIFRGGSTVWLSEWLAPKKLVAVDLSERSVPDLENYIQRRGLEERIAVCGGVNQQDISALDAVYREHFGDEPLDVVVDDASHLLDETKTSFNFLFPRLRPGGLYVIEDWNAEMVFLGFVQQGSPLPAVLRERRPLSILLMQIIATLVPGEAAIQGVCLDGHSAYIVRGDAPLDRQTFDISSRLIVRAEFDGSNGFLADGDEVSRAP